jgi:DDE superfamily endonuclease
MWQMIPSLACFVDYFRPIFTTPAFHTHCTILLGWVMCLGPRTLFRVFLSSRCPAELHDFSGPHGLDTEYNFFERTAWTPSDLFKRLALFVLTHLPFARPIRLIVDDTLLHKRGVHVWGLGWFRDAVASTKTRVATASGHNWVVLAIAFEIPKVGVILALPVMARLHRPGEGLPSCAQLAREMVEQMHKLFPHRQFVLLGDGEYSNSVVLAGLPGLGDRLEYTGRMRSDASLYDPNVPEQPKGKPGRKPGKGPKLPTPKQVATLAVPPGQQGEYQWEEVKVRAYGQERLLWACAFIALWPSVLGYRPIRVVVVRDPEGVMDDCYLMATNSKQSVADLIRDFSWRWAIEVMFKSCKQVLDIQGPQHYAQQSVQRVAPWVWCLQTVLSVWYIVLGQLEPEAEEIRQHMGEWDTEWSLKNMLRVLRRATLNAAINANSGSMAEMRALLERLKNWVHLTA